MVSISADETLVDPGETIRITCTATGIPTPTITWLRKFASNDIRDALDNSRIDIIASFSGSASNTITSILVIRVSVN